MKTSTQRFALLTGVSVSAMGVCAPAMAATTPGVSHNLSGENVFDELVISAIGDPALDFGVTVDGTSSAFAIIDSASNGEIIQVGNAYGPFPTSGLLTLEATNAGDVSIEAIAHASNATGSATARAHTERGVYQAGLATTKSSLTLDNSGELAIGAQASAAGTSALALATMSTAILQVAAGPISQVQLSNEGDIAVTAWAAAEATAGSAVALAGIDGIDQAAHGYTSGLISFANDGTLEIAAGASAAGFVAGVASATVNYGIAQSASASASDGFAQVSLENSGALGVSATAAAAAQMSAVALADVREAIYQHATGSGGGAAATLTNSGTMEFAAAASAVAENDGNRPTSANAKAEARGIDQYALARTESYSSGSSGATFHIGYTVLPHGPASISLDNSGTIALTADAAAAADDAFALAAVTEGVQIAKGTEATISFDNSGVLSGSASAVATGQEGATAAAFASGLFQYASTWGTELSVTVTTGGAGHVGELIDGHGPASASFQNSGSYSLDVDAHAEVAGATASASPYAYAFADIGMALNQEVYGSVASASVVNDGDISLAASASAVAEGMAIARADVNGFVQNADATGLFLTANWTTSTSTGFVGTVFAGPAVDTFTNSGSFQMTAVAKADGTGFAEADVHATGGTQAALGLTATAQFDNGGLYAVTGTVEARGSSEFAQAIAAGLDQFLFGGSAAHASITNSGTMEVHAVAEGTATAGFANDVAVAGRFQQVPLSPWGPSTASFVNEGVVDVTADASAHGAAGAFAGAYAVGVLQDPLFVTVDASLANDGTMSFVAKASAAADSGNAYASAVATAYYVDGANVVADVENDGSITAAASAVENADSGSAYAYAAGFTMWAANHLSATSVVAGSMAGTIANAGELHVSAKVDSANGGTVGATATGIYLNSTRNNLTIDNSGLIDVEAVTNGGPAAAYGVHSVAGWRGNPSTADDLFTFTNDGGTIIVRQSTDGGATWQHGMAIDVSEAPNASVINLLGDGSIYGDIAIQDGDRIEVADGTTYFDGVINPALLPAGGVTSATLDSGLSGVGTLDIGGGGNLELADARLTGDAAMYDGPAYAVVDTFAVASDGTITFQLQPASGGIQAAGTYGQVFADNASLDGALVADIATANGLFADSYTWENVIDANSLDGKFDSCALGGGYSGSVLLSLACSYDSGSNVDLKLTRKAFGEVTGLNGNALAVASGLDCIYDPALTGNQVDLLGDLFRISDSAKYDVALNQLSGSAYANYLNALPGLGIHSDDLIDRATGCEDASACRGSGPVRLWGQADYRWTRADGDSEAGTSTFHDSAFLAGLDARVGESASIGISGGSITSHMRDSQFGDRVETDGIQVGAYGSYDSGPMFVKALATYSTLDGNSVRSIDFAPLGGSFAARPTGHAVAKLWTFALRGGTRLPLGGSSVVTPYASVDFVGARMHALTEDSTNGGALSLRDSKSDHTFLGAGVKWAGQVGPFIGKANLGYRYRLGDAASQVGAAFAGDEDCGFDVSSASQDRGSVVAGLSVGAKLRQAMISVNYDGAFNGDLTSHGGSVTLTIPLGGGTR